MLLLHPTTFVIKRHKSSLLCCSHLIPLVYSTLLLDTYCSILPKWCSAFFLIVNLFFINEHEESDDFTGGVDESQINRFRKVISSVMAQLKRGVITTLAVKFLYLSYQLV